MAPWANPAASPPPALYTCRVMWYGSTTPTKEDTMIRITIAAALVAGGLAVTAAPAEAFTAYVTCERTLAQADKGDTRHEVREVFKRKGHTLEREDGRLVRQYSCVAGLGADVTFERDAGRWVLVKGLIVGVR